MFEDFLTFNLRLLILLCALQTAQNSLAERNKSCGIACNGIVESDWR
jgi:hypothetical protein